MLERSAEATRRSLLALAALGIFGCSSPSEIGKSQTDAAFPKQSDETVEAELKKNPEAWAKYQESKRQDAAYEEKGR